MLNARLGVGTKFLIFIPSEYQKIGLTPVVPSARAYPMPNTTGIDPVVFDMLNARLGVGTKFLIFISSEYQKIGLTPIVPSASANPMPNTTGIDPMHTAF